MDELSRRLACKAQYARTQRRTRCWCPEPKWLCSVLWGKPFPGSLRMESFIASLPSGRNSSQEWKISAQLCTQTDFLWQCTLVLTLRPPLHLTPESSFGSSGKGKFPSTLIGSVVKPKN